MFTNSELDGRKSPFIDGDKKSRFPYYESDFAAKHWPGTFSDSPGRQIDPSKNIRWQAVLCMYCVEGDGLTIRNQIKCLSWGFSISRRGKLAIDRVREY